MSKELKLVGRQGEKEVGARLGKREKNRLTD